MTLRKTEIDSDCREMDVINQSKGFKIINKKETGNNFIEWAR